MNTGRLKVLLAEDVSADGELCLDALIKAGFLVDADVCATVEDFEHHVEVNDYDIILADYNLSDWTGVEAIEIVKRLGKDIPVIVVTGALGDEKAVDCIHQGAADYVLKDRLSRLPSAVRRAIDENVLRGQSRLLAAAVCSVREGVLIVEAASTLSNARIVSLNQAFAQITGYSSEELIGTSLDVFRTSEGGKAFFEDYEANSSNLVLCETRQERKDGSVYDAEWQISPIRDNRSRISHYVVLHHDITDRKRAAAELIRTNEALVLYSEKLKDAMDRAESATQAKSDFLASISHEIRTPLNAIIGMADLLSETRLTLEQGKYVLVFQRAGENLLILINQLLDLSKIESGKLDLEHIDFDLTAVLARTMALFDGAARAKGLSLSYFIGDHTSTQLIGDPYHLQQVLTNLIGNAIKFTKTGSVTLEANSGTNAAPTESLIHFRVADTGVGIPADKLKSIFENFTQADSSTTRQYGGTGLGLAISRTLVHLMKGNLTVESAVGAGSTFSFDATFGLQLVQPKVTPKSTPWKILLCEDSQDNAFLVGAYLAGSNYLLEHVPDGKAGADRFESDKFDVVLMDMQMPILDGHAATRRIREFEDNHARKPTPILALTAHAQLTEEKRCEASGCTAFLTKPIRKATLLAALAKHVPRAGGVIDESDLPPEVIELIPDYLARKHADLEALDTAIQEADYATISTLGHQLKGSGICYGFEEFSEIGVALEESAKAHDLVETRHHVNRLSQRLSEALTVSSNVR